MKKNPKGPVAQKVELGNFVRSSTESGLIDLEATAKAHDAGGAAMTFPDRVPAKFSDSPFDVDVQAQAFREESRRAGLRQQALKWGIPVGAVVLAVVAGIIFLQRTPGSASSSAAATPASSIHTPLPDPEELRLKALQVELEENKRALKDIKTDQLVRDTKAMLEKKPAVPKKKEPAWNPGTPAGKKPQGAEDEKLKTLLGNVNF